MKLPSVFGVTGTDTNVGKTFVSAILARKLGAGYWKPIQAGTDPHTDTQEVQKLSALPDHHFFPETYRLTMPASPHLAARCENTSIQLTDFSLPDYSPLPHLIIEGAGGILVPINDHDYIVDLFAYLQLPLIVVARSMLGTINATLLTINELRRRNLTILGVLLNGPKTHENRRAIETYGRVRILGEIDTLDQVNAKTIGNLCLSGIH